MRRLCLCYILSWKLRKPLTDDRVHSASLCGMRPRVSKCNLLVTEISQDDVWFHNHWVRLSFCLLEPNCSCEAGNNNVAWKIEIFDWFCNCGFLNYWIQYTVLFVVKSDVKWLIYLEKCDLVTEDEISTERIYHASTLVYVISNSI